jgi:putative hydrolase of the HAD superfamily
MSWQLFFDLDRTLWHHEANCADVLAEFCSEFPELKHLDPAHVAQRYQVINDGLWEIIQEAGYGVDYVRNRRFPFLLQELVPELPTKERRELAEVLERAFTQRTPTRGATYPAVAETLRLLKEAGYGVHVLTNGVTSSQERKIAAMGLTEVVDSLTTSDASASYKPDRGIFTYAMRLAGCGPEEAVMIGDSRLRDVGGGKAAGMRTLWFDAPDALPPDGDSEPDGTFHHFAELPDALRRIGA